MHLASLATWSIVTFTLHRNPKLRPVLAKFPGEEFEEILASLVGSILLGESESSQTLVWKAAAELTDLGATVAYAERLVERLIDTLRKLHPCRVRPRRGPARQGDHRGRHQWHSAEAEIPQRRLAATIDASSAAKPSCPLWPLRKRDLRQNP